MTKRLGLEELFKEIIELVLREFSDIVGFGEAARGSIR